MTTPTKFEPGIYPDLSEDVYRAAEGISQSSLKLMAISPRHYLTKATEKPQKPTEAQRMGTLTHRFILQNRREYVVRPQGMKFTTKEGMAWRDSQTQEIVSTDDEAALLGMRASVMAHPIAKSIMERPGQNEVACFKRCPETGLMLKGRSDRLCMDDQERMVIPDLKTCGFGDASLAEFTNEIYKWKYEMQGAHYLNLFGASFFVFIVVEKEPPYACATYTLKSDAVARGNRLCAKYLRQVKECVVAGKWPAYPEMMQEIGVPEWVLRKENEL